MPKYIDHGATQPSHCQVALYLPHSISVLQWLCNAETSSPTSSPPFRLQRFFTTLHASLTRGARAIFQFYPQSDDQVELIMGIAMRAGFQGGLVVDYPNSRKAKKFFLCLFTGGENASRQRMELPQPLTGEPIDEEDDNVGRVKFEKQRARDGNGRGERGKKRKHPKESSKDWILRKKEVRSFQCPNGLEFSNHLFFSCIDSVAKKVCLEIQNSQEENEKQCFKPLDTLLCVVSFVL